MRLCNAWGMAKSLEGQICFYGFSIGKTCTFSVSKQRNAMKRNKRYKQVSLWYTKWKFFNALEAFNEAWWAPPLLAIESAAGLVGQNQFHSCPVSPLLYCSANFSLVVWRSPVNIYLSQYISFHWVFRTVLEDWISENNKQCKEKVIAGNAVANGRHED